MNYNVISAIKHNDMDKLRKLAKNPKHIKPDYFTCRCGCGKEFEKESPLYEAIDQDNLEAAQILVEAGTPISAVSVRRAYRGHKKIFEYFLEKEPYCIDWTKTELEMNLLGDEIGFEGETWSPESVSYLLENGANPNFTCQYNVGDAWRQKPVMARVIKKDSPELLQLILDKSKYEIDLDWYHWGDYDGNTFTLFSIASDKMKLFLLDKGAKADFIEAPSLAVLNKAIEKGYDFKAVRKVKRFERGDDIKDWLLWQTLKKGDKKVAEVLVDHGADIKTKKYPLTEAIVESDKASLMSWAFSKGLQISKPEETIKMACENGNAAMLKVLLQNGCKSDSIQMMILDARYIDGETRLALLKIHEKYGKEMPCKVATHKKALSQNIKENQKE